MKIDHDSLFNFQSQEQLIQLQDFTTKTGLENEQQGLLKYFTKEERKVIYNNFLREDREVEFGVCCKHQSEGSCEHLDYYMCATCSKLIIGKSSIASLNAIEED